MPKAINVKTHLDWFNRWIMRNKSFEVRKNDRDYQVGDLVYQHEYDPVAKTMTGRVGMGRVKFVLTHASFPDGIKPGYCIIEVPFLKLEMKQHE